MQAVFDFFCFYYMVFKMWLKGSEPHAGGKYPII